MQAALQLRSSIRTIVHSWGLNGGTLKKIIDLQVFLGPVLSGISASEWLVYGFLRLVEVRVSLLGHGYD